MIDLISYFLVVLAGCSIGVSELHRRWRRFTAAPRALQLVERLHARRKRSCTQQPLCDPGDCEACDYDHATAWPNTRPRDMNHNDFCVSGTCSVCDQARQIDADWEARQARKNVPALVREVPR